ncbi:MAG: hypothetical protein KBT48_07275, partial [Firmicutes bacterium]|nr:hypothetical protein [Bacillota bacterium]
MKKLLSFLFIALSLVACKASLVIDKEDAKEIALDAAGYIEDEVKNLSVSEKNGFDVTFTSDGGEYQYHINSDGIVSKRSVKSYTSLDEEDVIEKKDKVKEEKEEQENELDEETKSKAISTALTNLGLREEQVKDIEVELKEDETISVKCTVIANGNRFETVIN